MLGQGNYLTVQDEVSSSQGSTGELQACKLLADYLSAPNDESVAAVKSLLKSAPSDAVRLLAATLYANHGDDDNALRCVRGSSDLECLALAVQIYLKLNRPDLAEKELKAMQAIDDDHTATQLANAWLLIAAGGEKYEDAFNIFHELVRETQRDTITRNPSTHLTPFYIRLRNILQLLFFSTAWLFATFTKANGSRPRPTCSTRCRRTTRIPTRWPTCSSLPSTVASQTRFSNVISPNCSSSRRDTPFAAPIRARSIRLSAIRIDMQFDFE
jgi:hypothetical protein